jgi:hypothetical protein
LLHTLQTNWFNKLGIPKTILLKQGKVQISKLEKKIYKRTPLPKTVACRSQSTTFNTETEQQWQQNQHQLPEEEFINAVNFFHNLRNPELGERSNHQMAQPGTCQFHDNHEDQIQEDEEGVDDQH